MRARILLITPMILGAPTMATADGHGGAHKIGFGYHIMHDYDDNGFSKVDGADAPAKTFTTSSRAYVDLSGSMDKSSYRVYMDAAAATLGSGVEVAFAQTEVCKGWQMGVGRNYINMGGFENANWDSQAIMMSTFNDRGGSSSKAFAHSGNVLQVDGDFGGGGSLTVQVIDDVTVTDADGDGNPDAGSIGQYNEAPQRQPTFAFQWTGSFGTISPMIQYVGYDQNHSTYTSLGLATEVAGAKIFFDYITDSRGRKAGDEKDVSTDLVLDVNYNAGMVSPFFKYTDHDVKQGGTDAKGNSSISDRDDNYNQILVGTTVNMYKHMEPYFAVKMSNAMVLNDKGKAKSKSAQSLMLGFRGTF